MPRRSRSFPEEPVIPPGGERHVEGRTLEALVRELLDHPGIGENIVHVERLPAREAVYGDWPEALDPALRQALSARGIDNPWSHQAEAVRHALEGQNVVSVTPTASGKSLSYNVPVLQSILKNPSSRSLYLFPTKALSHDQYGELYELSKACGRDIKVYTYDGDTPPATRRALRDAGHLIVTNPDMLHTGILPHHTSWIRLFENLDYVVLDELHQYRGVFGSHLANVLRRLLRLCAFYGRKPIFLGSSATIANPKGLAEALTGQPFEVVSESGAPAGEKVFVFYNPPVINRELGVRRNVRLEARRIAMRFLARNYQAIVFGRSRLDVEVMTTYLKRGMARLHRDPQSVTGYRGGYLPTERRAIEQGLKQRDLLGVVSTNALELGIDIGSLDVSIMAGWPGSVASAWQRAGRAGRKAGTSVAVYIAGSSPLDQFLVNNPDFFFGSNPEEGLVNPENVAILSSHLKCGAFELPFEDSESFGDTDPAPILQFLEDESLLRHTAGRWYYSSDVYPAEDVSLRSASGENFIVLDTGRKNQVIAEVDYDSAPFLIHDDAVYIHNAKTYLVEKLDWDRRTAYVRHKKVDYYTDAESSSNIQVLQVDEEEVPENSPVLAARRLGEVSVATIIAKFKKVKFETQESIGYGPVTVPQLEISTEGFWLSFRQDLIALFRKDGKDLAPALRGVAQLLRHAIPLYVLCDTRDFAVYSMLRAPFDQLPSIYIWDKYPGGIGISRRAHRLYDTLLEAARRMVTECPCPHGCPACVGAQLEKRGETKQAALWLLDRLLADAAGEKGE